jgi:LysM repeat protein
MKPKEKPGSKISATYTNTGRTSAGQKNTQPNTVQPNRTKSPAPSASGTSLLKKNEFTLIIVGALVVTVIVFFMFFKSPGAKNKNLPGLASTTETGGSFSELEKRISAIEFALERIKVEGVGALGTASGTPAELVPLQQKVQRIETAVSVKFDSLIERMGNMEKQMRKINQGVSTQVKVPVKTAANTKSSKKAVSKKVASKTVTSKTTQAPVVKTAMFHTVKKGETLWSISQKYKTKVTTLRKLNNMSNDATLYPGTNILVR